MTVGRHAKIFVLGLLFACLGIMLATINFAPEYRGLDPGAGVERMTSTLLEGLYRVWWVVPINAGVQWMAFRMFPKLSGFLYCEVLGLGWFVVSCIYYFVG